MNGDKVGDEQVTKQFGELKSLDSWTDTTLTKGSCDSVDWGKEFPGWSSDIDGVTATAWEKDTAAEEKKAKEAAEAAKIDAFKGVGHWFLYDDD